MNRVPIYIKVVAFWCCLLFATAIASNAQLNRNPRGTAGDSSLDLESKSRWVHFSSSLGLPTGEIMGLVESVDSTLWVSTLTGVAWFDGYQWHREGRSGKWPGRGDGSFRGELRDSLILHSIDTEFIGNKNGFRPLFRRVNGGLALIGGDTTSYPETEAFFRLFNEAAGRQPDPKYAGRIGLHFQGRDKSEWMVLGNSLCRWQDGAWQPKITPANAQPSLSVAVVRENSRGSGVCLIRTPLEKVGIWEWNNGGPPVQTEFEKRMPFITGIDIDEQGNVVAFARTGEIYLRQHGVWRVLPFFPESVNRISAVLFRRNGDLCVGGEDGLFIWRRSFNTWTSLPPSPVELKNCVNELLLTRTGDLWIGTADGIDVRYANGKTMEVTSIGKERIMNVTGLQEDVDGNVWASSGSSFDGAYRWDGKRWTFYPVTKYEGGIMIHKIRKDSHGRLWFLGLGHNIGTSDDDEAGAFLLENGTFTRTGVKEGLLNGRVYAFTESADGAMWFGTLKGICRRKNNQWTYWPSSTGNNLDHIFCLAADHEGGIWFGQMRATGLGYVGLNDSVRYYSMNDGLPDNRVYDVKVDSGGVVWIATRGGLSSYDGGTWSIFDEKSGLVSDALWPVLPFGDRVLVGTTGQGVAILSRQQGRSHNPRIIIQPPLVDNENAFLRWTAIAFYGEVSPENALSRYQVDDNPWSSWSTLHEVSLKQLGAGQHSVRVQARGLFGQYNAVPEAASFTILPPLYLRPGIYIPASCAAAALLTLLVMFQIRRVRHRQEIARSEERYRLITELMSDYAFLNRVEPDGGLTILWLTDSFTRKTGFTIVEAGTPTFLAHCIHPDDLPGAQEILKNVLIGIPSNQEWRLVTKTGEVLWTQNYIAPMWDANHQAVTHIYGIATDITARKDAERQLIANQSQLRSLTAELSMTEERERRRMATFLHDSIGQALALTKMKLSIVQGKVAGTTNENELREIRELIERSIQDTRSLTFDLSPPVLHQLGFVASIEWLLGELRARHPIQFEFCDDGIRKPLDDEYAVFLFHAVRELVHNVIKHTHALQVRVELAAVVDNIVITIEDDGEGFDQDSPVARGTYAGGYGLFNIRERTTHFGGNFQIVSTPGKGTRISITMPMGKQFAKEHLS